VAKVQKLAARFYKIKLTRLDVYFRNLFLNIGYY
jgi:hypothetical protein